MPQNEKRGLGVTLRRDTWWLQPLAVATGFGAFIIYTTWAGLQGKNYEWGPYLSPFYSPLFKPSWLGSLSPAILILWGPGGFRATCYYYRKAYYRAFFLDPPACAVGEASEHRYCGENSLPLKLQNIHRYFMYVAVVVLALLWWDAIRAFSYQGQFGLGLGTLIMVGNAVFLSCYTFGCHSLRHLIGGRFNSFHNCGSAHSCWKGVTNLNEHHQLWAWVSLFSVGLTDIYIRLVASGMIHDPNTWGL
jgi:hypothetical protein